MTVTTAVTAVTALGAATLGGLFWAFSTSVMPALARRPGAEAAAAMQEVNRAILNPVFLVVFVGTAVGGVATAVLGVGAGDWPAVAGAALAVIGAHGITAAVNVPLNTALDAAEPSAVAWERFAGPWNRAHRIRTLLTLAGAAVLFVASAG